MADPMKIRANLVGDATEVKALMSHEMETGQRKDADGKVIPAWFIQTVTVTHAAHILLQTHPMRNEEQTKLQERQLYDRIKNGGELGDMRRHSVV